MKHQPSNILRAILAELRDVSGAAPGAAPAPDPALAPDAGAGAGGGPEDDLGLNTGEDEDVMNELPEPNGTENREAGGRYGALKELARKDLPTLKHLLALKKAIQENGDLNGKEASLSLQSILTRLFRYSENSALQFGRIEWQPDLVAWTGFFDDMGDMKLGEYLGINSVSELPKGPASEADGGDGGDLAGADGTGELPDANGAPVPGSDPEVPGLDAPANPEADAGAGSRPPAPRPARRQPVAAMPRESVASVRFLGDRIHLVEGTGMRIGSFHRSSPHLFEDVARFCRRKRLQCPQLDFVSKRILPLPTK